MMPIGWAVVGTGWHVRDRMAPAGMSARDTRLVAVCSRDLERAQRYANDFGFDSAYSDYSEMLANKHVDVVYLATPNSLHARQTIEAAAAGKHVLVEKPMALSSADARRMIAACEEAGVRLGVGFHLRHHPLNVAIRDLIRAGNIGTPVLLRLQWVRFNERREGWWRVPDQVGAYVTMARGVHLLDLVRFLSGGNVTEVSAASDGQRIGKPLEDTMLVTARLSDGAFAHLVASRLFRGTPNTLDVYGTDGAISALGSLGTDPAGEGQTWRGDVSRRIHYEPCDPFVAEIEAFNQSIHEGTQAAKGGADGLASVLLTEAVLEAARSHSVVTLSEPES